MVINKDNKIYARFDKELLCIEPWGKNGLRIRATQRNEFISEDFSALLPGKEENGKIYSTESGLVIENGKIKCLMTPTGKLVFFNQNKKILLEEYERNRNVGEEGRKDFNSALEINSRTYFPIQNTDNYSLVLRFESNKEEKLFGMGQYQQEFLDLKGCILELAQRNSQITVPFVLSDNGYGFLWNNPAVGEVSFGKNITEWKAYSTKQIDYWITTGDTPAEIEESYADVVGKVPMMPSYGLGFWQCKLRYQTQEEILKIATEYKKRNLPIDVIVVDFFHWPHEGEWKFDECYWPNVEELVCQLREMGIELMVSIWPTVEEESENFLEMQENGYLVRSEYGKRLGQLGNSCMIDVTNPECRQYVWNKIKKNYYEKGIKIFWMDEAEPELTGYEYNHYRYYRGAAMEIGNIYPREYARMVYEGMQKEGQENIVNLLRCAWAGSQKYGTLIWSGDIDSSFQAMRNQLSAGLNMGIAGFPWWTTDIGGFHGGNIYDPKFHELFVRWFQFGTFCPVMRLHGDREPFQKPIGTKGGGKVPSGADNEVWSYGEKVYKICKKYMFLRERLKPYIKDLMLQAHKYGTPVIRPLFYDFPEDSVAWEIEDSYMFGPDIYVAPILYENLFIRKLYLPKGVWICLEDGTVHKGGEWVIIDAPLDTIPVFVRKGTLEYLFE